MMGLREHGIEATGTRMQAQDGAVDDPNPIGIDYEALEEGVVVDHIMNRDENPFADHAPERFSQVQCEPPNCPLVPAEVQHLDMSLDLEFDTVTKSMEIRKMIWDRALSLCHSLA